MIENGGLSETKIQDNQDEHCRTPSTVDLYKKRLTIVKINKSQTPDVMLESR